MELTIQRKQLIRILTRITFVLIFLSLLTVISISVFDRGNLLGLVPMFNMDRESNIPTLFSFLLLLSAGGLFSLLSRQLAAASDRFTRHVTLLSFIFVFMAVDEYASIHELFTEPLAFLAPESGIFHFAWVIAAIPFVIVVGLYFLRFFLAQSKEFKIGLFSAGFIYIFGAVGMEMVGSSIHFAYGYAHIAYGLATIVEESCEIFGVIILIHTLLGQLLKNGDMTLLHITLKDQN